MRCLSFIGHGPRPCNACPSLAMPYINACFWNCFVDFTYGWTDLSTTSTGFIAISRWYITYGTDWLAYITVNHSLDFTNKFRSSFFLLEQSTLDLSNSFQILCLVYTLTHKHSEMFLLRFLASMLCHTVYCFQISGGVNCIMVLLSSQIVLNWLWFAA